MSCSYLFCIGWYFPTRFLFIVQYQSTAIFKYTVWWFSHELKILLFKLRLIYVVTGFYVSHFHVQKCKRIWNSFSEFFFFFLLEQTTVIKLRCWSDLSHYLELGSLYMSGQTRLFFPFLYLARNAKVGTRLCFRLRMRNICTFSHANILAAIIIIVYIH